MERILVWFDTDLFAFWHHLHPPLYWPVFSQWNSLSHALSHFWNKHSRLRTTSFYQILNEIHIIWIWLICWFDPYALISQFYTHNPLLIYIYTTMFLWSSSSSPPWSPPTTLILEDWSKQVLQTNRFCVYPSSFLITVINTWEIVPLAH